MNSNNNKNNKNNRTNPDNILAQLENIYIRDFEENIASPFFNLYQVNTYCCWVRDIIRKIKVLPECCGSNDLVVSSGRDGRKENSKWCDYFIKLQYTKFNFGENKNIKYLMIYFYGNYDVSVEEKIVDKNDKNDKNNGVLFKRRIINRKFGVEERINEIVREWMEE